MSKPWYRSLTMVAGAVFAGVQFLESTGGIPAGAVSQVTAAVEAVAGLAALFGLRRAMP